MSDNDVEPAGEPAAAGLPQTAPAPRPPRRGGAGRIIKAVIALVFVFSVLLNFYLLAVIILAAGDESPLETALVRDGDEKQVVALYSVTDVIADEAAALFDAFVTRVVEDKNVKAVVLRVESPGGSVSASDRICHMVQRLKQEGRKVVVSMGGVAASGGYYISAPADEIYVEPTTMTGSIGVIAQWPVVSGTLEKIGVEMVIVKSRHAENWKDQISPFRKPDAEQLERIRQVLDKVQARFEQIVKDGRSGKLKPFKPPLDAAPATQPAREYEAFDGKIYLADEAVELGLADATGYLRDAIDRAAALAELSKPKVVRYRRRMSLMEKLGMARQGRTLAIEAETLDKLQTPRILLMWKAD